MACPFKPQPSDARIDSLFRQVQPDRRFAHDRHSGGGLRGLEQPTFQFFPRGGFQNHPSASGLPRGLAGRNRGGDCGQNRGEPQRHFGVGSGQIRLQRERRQHHHRDRLRRCDGRGAAERQKRGGPHCEFPGGHGAAHRIQARRGGGGHLLRGHWCGRPETPERGGAPHRARTAGR